MSSFRSKRFAAAFAGPPWQVAAAWLAGALLAQLTIVHDLAVRGAVPSFVLLVVVWYAVRADIRWAALFGLIAGFLEDAMAGATGGAWTISTTLTAILVSLLSRGFFADSIPLVGVITVVATLARAAAFWIVMGFQGYPQGLGTYHFHQALLQALWNLVAMTVVMLAYRRFDARLK